MLMSALIGLGVPGVASAQQPAASRSGRDVCRTLAETPWPATPSGLAQLLARMEDRRESCIENAAFLGLLGALWLEQGDPAQALLWLERSLMLDPSVPVTLADHALALAALGDRTAVGELLERWRSRADVPPLVRARLELAQRGPEPRSDSRAGRLAAAGAGGFAWRRSVSLMRGYDSNLDHSPRLDELRLTTPDGPIMLPLVNPLVPRKGHAWIAEGTLGGGYAPSAGLLWEGEVQFSGRRSSDEPGTDTRQIQLALARWQQHGGWRSQLQVAAQRVTGPLYPAQDAPADDTSGEPFRTYSLSVAAEYEWNGCWSRLGAEAESRRQDRSRVLDSHTASIQGGLNCRLRLLPGWTGSAALRLGWDRPRDPGRPGGPQRQTEVGLRAGGPLAAGIRAVVSARAGQLLDREGYSPLLESNARRRQTQHQYSVELSRALPLPGLGGVDLVIQFQRLRRTSNLELFQSSGHKAFTGLRADW